MNLYRPSATLETIVKPRLITIAVAISLTQGVLAQPASQNPCSLLGVPGTFSSISGTHGCIVPPAFGQNNGQPHLAVGPEDLGLRLATQTISDLRTLISEIQGLRAEMRAYQASLAQAKAGFDTASKATTSAQEAWRTTALDETLKSVQQIPTRLATNEDLRKALAAALKAELPTDPAFVQAVRQAAAP